jgi:hypothetical protein
MANKDIEREAFLKITIFIIFKRIQNLDFWHTAIIKFRVALGCYTNKRIYRLYHIVFVISTFSYNLYDIDYKQYSSK